jgi:hypothetical protein
VAARIGRAASAFHEAGAVQLKPLADSAASAAAAIVKTKRAATNLESGNCICVILR